MRLIKRFLKQGGLSEAVMGQNEMKITRPSFRAMLRYGGAVLVVTLALLLTMLIWPVIQPLVAPLFIAALIICAWYGGTGPAVLATILTAFVLDYFFLPPVYALLNGWDDISRTLMFVIEGVLIILLVNAHKRTVGELRESEDRFRLLVEGVRDYAIYMLDREGRVVSWNYGAETIKGYRAEEIIGEHFSRFYTAEDVAQGRPARELRLAEADGRYEEEGWRVRKDGMRFWANVIVTPLRDRSGRLHGFSKVTRDITERKQAEEALRKSHEELELRVEQRTAELSRANAELKKEIAERRRVEEERAQILVREQEARKEAEAANRAKDEFLATVSHELRTPLTPILTWARLLGTGKLDEANFKRALEIIERNVKSQTKLVEDLLDISRIITGKLRFDVRQVDPVPVLEAAVEAVRLAADAKNIRIHSSLDAAAGPIMGDPVRLQQVVWNLLSNAIKFTPEGGDIEIKLVRADTHAQIIVSDTGQGISREFLPHVFERFSQADGTLTKRHGGLGLGLSIVRHLVELHGGTVQAESLGEGQGATFTLDFPLSTVREAADLSNGNGEGAQSIASNRAVEPFPPELHGLRVLLVDDEADTRDSLIAVLELCGIEVTAVASVREALEVLERLRPDVLLSDIGMPGENGYELIRKVRSLEQDWGGRIPAAALTAYASAEDQRHALSAGFQMHIPKPVEPAELIAVITNLTGRNGRG